MTSDARLIATGTRTGKVSPAVFAAHLAANAERYFPELGGGAVAVRLTRERVRPASLFYAYDVQIGATRKEVLVKMPVVRSTIGNEDSRAQHNADRPRLAQPAPTETKFLLEHETLAAIRDHFLSLDDSRFGAVRTLAILFQHRALVMETVQGSDLRKLFYASHRARSQPVAADLHETFHNSGAWLRAYHAITLNRSVEPRHTRRTDYLHFIDRVGAFLGSHLADAQYFNQVVSVLTAAAQQMLPDRLPLGLGHGDFALRNVLVGSRSRVTVLDTLGRYRTPIYEDIGYFLVSLHCNWPSVLSLGVAFPFERVKQYEHAFLSGYFGGEPVPYGAVRLYEIQAMLDLWSSVAWRVTHAAGLRARTIGSIKLILLSRFLRKRVLDTLLDVPTRGVCSLHRSALSPE